MQLGRVIGTATATVKHPTFQGERLLVVQLETEAGRPDGEPILVFDRLGAGRETGCSDQRRPGPPGAAGADHAGPLERDGPAGSMSQRDDQREGRFVCHGSRVAKWQCSRIGNGTAPVPHSGAGIRPR